MHGLLRDILFLLGGVALGTIFGWKIKAYLISKAQSIAKNIDSAAQKLS